MQIGINEGQQMYEGLSSKEAKEKLSEFRLNEIRELIEISPLQILLRQVKNNFIIYILFAAMLISIFVGKTITAYVIFFIIGILIFVGFIQEYRAEKAIKELKQMIVPISILIRDGKQTEVESKYIVPGDIIVLRTGEKIPADCIILEEKELKVNESVLTGESREIKKTAAKNEKNYGKENRVFMGTFITRGKCIGKVIHTGMNAEFGKIAGMISKAEKELPLQIKVNQIAKYMAAIALSTSILTGVIMTIRSLPFSYDLFIEVLITVIALSVSAFPEGFPVVLIATLAAGAHRMAKKNAIVNRMSIIETLGETTIICADKTGTITKGEMTAKKIVCEEAFDVGGSGFEATGKITCKGKEVKLQNEPALNLILKASVYCNDSIIERTGNDSEYKIIGSPTEAALLILSAKVGIFKEDLKGKRIEEIPFSSERKMMSVLCEEEHGKQVYAKGAVETIIRKCQFIQKKDKISRLTQNEKKKILETNSKLTIDSYRTLALAYKKTNSSKSSLEEELVFLGLIGMEDPPREEVKNAIKTCKTAGIGVKMITGDNKETAMSISKAVGISGEILEGEDLDKITDEELTKIVKKTAIFARVRPEHKLRIVKALKENGEIVTMTGDGVNDAPALKEAHIGVAMGKNGTAIAREASDLTLKDDNFSTIVTAISEGRNIFSNIRKFITYQLSCNYAELIIIFLGILLGFPLPLIALQILFMNIVTDDLPAITLGLARPLQTR